MKCNLENREDLISKYLMNELSDEESLHFEEHYFTCEACFSELKTVEQALSLVAKEGKTAFTYNKVKSSRNIFSYIPVFSTRAKIGFSFAALILLFVLYSVFFNKVDEVKTDQKIISQEKEKSEPIIDSSKTESENQIGQEENLIAEFSGPDFELNPYYEEWINENVRSGNNIIEKVIAPKNDTKFYDDIAFKWIMKEQVPVLLSVLKNSEEKIFLTEVENGESSEVSKSVSKNIFKKSGLYYWRIENENEVLYVGKFYFFKRQ